MTRPATVRDPGNPTGPRSRTRGRRRFLRLFGSLDPRVYASITIASLTGMFAVWWVVAEARLVSDLFLPSPAQVWDRAFDLLADGVLLEDVATSFGRITIGFLISTATALPVAIVVATYRPAEAAIQPPLDFIRYLPVAAFVPLTIIWIGIDETQKYAVIWIGTFFQQSLLFVDIIRRVPRVFVDIGRTLGLNDRSVLRSIVLPAASPAVWDAMRLTLGWAWSWLILAELVAATSGLGRRIVVAQRFFQTDTIFVAIVTIGLLGLVMDQAMRFGGRRLFPWAEERSR